MKAASDQTQKISPAESGGEAGTAEDALLALQLELARVKLELPHVQKALADHGCQLADACSCLVEWVEGDEMVVRAAHGYGDDVLGSKQLLSESLSGDCVSQGRPLICDDSETDDRVDQDGFRQAGLRSMAIVPVMYERKILGVIKVFSKKPHTFTPAVVKHYQLACSAAACAATYAGQLVRRRQFEEQLLREQMKFKIVSKATNDALWEWDLNLNQIWWSESMQTLFGYTASEIKSDAEWMTQHIHPEDRARVQQSINTVVSAGDEFWVCEYRFMRGNQQYAYVFERGYVMYENRKAVRIIGSMLDISERKRAEEKLKALAAELARSNRELQDFTSVASHDLQEPLNKVQMFTDRLKKELGEELNDKCKDYLERIVSGTTRMRTLINDLLSLSRVTTKAQPFVPVNVADIVTEVLSDLEARIEREQGQVQVGTLPVVDADPSQIRQLMQNLIGNGLKYHKPEVPPVVKVFARAFKERRQSSNANAVDTDLVQIFVMDNGIGFDEKYVDRIFAPFQRLVSRSEYEGTGMGLAITRKIVERHGGHITARSVVGEGSTFIVTMPMKQRQDASASSQ